VLVTAISRRRKTLFALVLLMATLLVGELLLTVARRVSSRVEYVLRPKATRMLYPDPVLGYRTSPHYPGHDRLGYRNERTPETSEIVAVGDSLTYGYSADAEHTWPRWLESLSQRSVYNAGVPSYGPVHYEVIAEESLALQPRTVILGLYLGNDILGAYDSVYVSALFRERASTDPRVLEEIRRVQAAGSLRDLAVARGIEESPPDQPRGIRSWLRSRSSLYALGRALTLDLFLEPPPPAWQRGDPFEESSALTDYIGMAEPRRFRSVFWNPLATGLKMELDEPRIREGWRITKDALLRVHRKLSEEEVCFVVVVLHTKPFIYSRALPDFVEEMPPGFAHLQEVEQRLTEEVLTFLDANGITAVDTTDALVDSFERGVSPFPESNDDHPDKDGYEAIARAILQGLGTLSAECLP
jgi:hypothetical protein